MITLRRAKKERHHDRRRSREAWSLDEDRLLPRASVPGRPHRGGELVIYVREGTLSYEDSMGRSGVIRAGEFQRVAVGSGLRHSETNASRTERAHVFQIWLGGSEPGLEPGLEQKRFSVAERRGKLCLVASPDARRGSLRIHQDVSMYSAVLDPGQHVVHALSVGRRAWLHLVEGEVTFGDVVLDTGDGVGVTDEHVVSLTARNETEILLLDLGEAPPKNAA